MTREEAHNETAFGIFIGIVNKIYDDFESRICKNCKWSNIASAKDCLECKFGIDDNSLSSYHQMVNKDFGCNKFTAKETT